MDERWLRCKVLMGMFSDERAVLIATTDHESVSVFVPEDRVQGQLDHEGKVRIRTLQFESKWWAVLPDGAQTIVPVDVGQLASA